MDNSASKPVSTLVGNCPSCKGYVRIPMDARPETNVRCPHCAQTFPVIAVLSLIPELEIVDEPVPERVSPMVDRQSVPRPTTFERKKFAVPQQLVSGARKNRKHVAGSRSSNVTAPATDEISMAHSSANEETESYEFDSAETEQPDAMSVMIEPDSITKAGKDYPSRGPRESRSEYAARARVHSSQRHRRMRPERRDPRVEILKVILGGVMAFPIAYLILLWGIGQDPLKLAPSLSKTIPFVVPKKMRTQVSLIQEEPARNAGDNGVSSRGNNGGEKTASDPNSESVEGPLNPIELNSNKSSLNSLQSIPDVAPDKK